MASWFKRTRNGKRRFVIKDSRGRYVTSIDADAKGAATLRDDIIRELDRQQHLAKAGIVEHLPCDWTLGELLDRVGKLTLPASAEFIRSVHSRLEAGFSRSRPIAEITRGDIDAYQQKRLETVKPRTVNSELLELRRALRMAREDWGEDSGYTGDPFRGWKRLPERGPAASPGRQSRAGVALTAAERRRLVAAARALARETNPGNRAIAVQNADIVEVLLLTASRLREVTRMRRDWISGGRVHFPPQKRGNPRAFLLEGRLAAILRPRAASVASPWVFPSPRFPDRPRDNLAAFWRKLTARAGLPGLRPHDLRHTAITEASEQGATDAELMRLAGWRTSAMISTYRKVRPAAMRPIEPARRAR